MSDILKAVDRLREVQAGTKAVTLKLPNTPVGESIKDVLTRISSDVDEVIELLYKENNESP